MEDEYGPPTQADEDWYWHHVALAQDRPPARNRQGEPMNGQLTIYDAQVCACGHPIESHRLGLCVGFHGVTKCRCPRYFVG